jgi:hypothetical protein
MIMDKQLDTVQEISLADDIIRDLFDIEVMLIGGGNIAVNGY